MKLSERVLALKPSATMALDARAKALKRSGIPVVSLAVGEPDFDTPQPIKDAAYKALKEGSTKYVEAAGIPELRAAISAKLLRDQLLAIPPEQISVTSGAKQAVFNAFQALLGNGDEILIPAPYWVSYPEMARLAGGVPVEVTWAPGFRIDLEDLARKITPRTRVLLLNSPNNPTGAVYPRADLERIAALAIQHDLAVVSDEIYGKLIYGGAEQLSIASLAGMLERTVVVDGCSKTFAMTGWRLGWAAGPKDLISAMTSLQSQSTSCVAPFVQKAAVEALTLGDALAAPMAREFDLRRKALLAAVRAWPGTRAAEPTGAFFVFADVSGVLGKRLDGSGPLVADDLALSDLALEHARVAMVPGSPFGAPGHLRLSYAAPLEILLKAAADVGALFGRLR